MHGYVCGFAEITSLSRDTMRKIRQSPFSMFDYNPRGTLSWGTYFIVF